MDLEQIRDRIRATEAAEKEFAGTATRCAILKDLKGVKGHALAYLLAEEEPGCTFLNRTKAYFLLRIGDARQKLYTYSEIMILCRDVA